jgi:hypothetical protein
MLTPQPFRGVRRTGAFATATSATFATVCPVLHPTGFTFNHCIHMPCEQPAVFQRQRSQKSQKSQSQRGRAGSEGFTAMPFRLPSWSRGARPRSSRSCNGIQGLALSRSLPGPRASQGWPEGRAAAWHQGLYVGAIVGNFVADLIVENRVSVERKVGRASTT